MSGMRKLRENRYNRGCRIMLALAVGEGRLRRAGGRREQVALLQRLPLDGNSTDRITSTVSQVADPLAP